MGRARATIAVCLATIGTLAVAGPAQAAKSCQEPGGTWERATPGEAGMDAAKLQSALDYGSSQASFAVRVYRHGCLVGEDRLAATNREERYESYSMAKSVTALLFGRAMTLREIGPDDPVGSLVPEADRPHGAIAMRDLLEMTSGLKWNGWRDYNVFTMPDRVRDALTLGVDHPPGTYFEYAQSTVALLAEAVGQSVGEDAQVFAQRQLMDALGIPAGDWRWTRDPAGHVQGFYGVQMRPDDFGRLGELLRRGGVWRGRRLLSTEFVREALTPSKNNGCYGWLIWLNGGAPCVGPTVGSRPVAQSREYPDLPADMWHFSGLFGQLVTVFPTQGIMIVRTGQDPGLLPGEGDLGAGASWEHELYTRVLAAVTDQRIQPGGDAPASSRQYDSDYGFQTALREPDQYSKGFSQDPLPPAGPGRARAAQLELVRERASRRGVVVFRLLCPTRWRGPGVPAGCRGTATSTGAPKALRYAVAPGKSKFLRFKLTRKRQRSLRRKGRMGLKVLALNADAADGVGTRLATTVRRPAKGAKPKKHRKRSRR
jgi:CubicO group peptidase (beta-lactamase class C family)